MVSVRVPNTVMMAIQIITMDVQIVVVHQFVVMVLVSEVRNVMMGTRVMVTVVPVSVAILAFLLSVEMESVKVVKIVMMEIPVIQIYVRHRVVSWDEQILSVAYKHLMLMDRFHSRRHFLVLVNHEDVLSSLLQKTIRSLIRLKFRVRHLLLINQVVILFVVTQMQEVIRIIHVQLLSMSMVSVEMVS